MIEPSIVRKQAFVNPPRYEPCGGLHPGEKAGLLRATKKKER
ncbi:MAG: hypothetical protein JWL93_2389 [Hyphomicrobiales bacterium]|nr:hypothetical protein [Hyphomicrobiales bacterium]